MSSNWDLANKWNAVRNQLIDADSPSGLIYVNFFSAEGGPFPHFVASGKSSQETDAPALWTGWYDGPFWPFNNCYHDNCCIEEFYRGECTFRVCPVAFKGVNIMAREFIELFVRIRTGIIMADFPGPGLIGDIIEMNDFI
jgi:1-phosphatidylinositol phosphodiesterase